MTFLSFALYILTGIFSLLPVSYLLYLSFLSFRSCGYNPQNKIHNKTFHRSSSCLNLDVPQSNYGFN
jgi:hypothetical protein